MNVTMVVDALGPQLSGIGRYVWELSSRVQRQPGIDSVAFFANGQFVQPAALMDGRPTRRRLRPPRMLRRRLIERRLRTSLVHGPNYFLPPEAESGIITIHDLSVFRYPDTHPVERVRAFERQFEGSLKRARHVITDTRSVRHELVEEFGVDASKISAIPLGVGQEYRPRQADDLGELEPLGLRPGGYALCVSTLEPRKKISELISAWRDLPSSLRNSTPLVIAGARGWLNEQLHEDIRAGVSAGWLKHLGFVPQHLLLPLYAGASTFIYPSIYEGFGLPPLEAMASGVPTLVADRSAVREVCGDAPHYIEPNDAKAFGAAIVGALTNESWRSRAREKGLERAAGFSWEKCAEETAELYRRCAS